MVERSPRDATAKPPALARVVPWLSRERSWRETAFLLRVRWRALLRGLDRRHLRSNEIALTVLSALVGMAVGFGVALVRQMMQWMHVVAYGMSPYHLLSEGIGLTWWRVLLVPVIGGAGLGIVTMLGVTWIERGFRRQSIPLWARPAIGGAVVGLMAFFWPQVLGSGHGAIESVIGRNFPPLALLLLIPAKAIASAVSVGSGFRGGLFSSSLFLGSLFGSVAGGLVALLLPGMAIDQLAYTLV